MPIKNILVTYNGTESADTALAYALRLAAANDAHLTGVLSHSVDYATASLGPYATAELLQIIEKNESQVREEIAGKFVKGTSGAGRDAKVHWLDVRGSTDNAVMEIARTFDVVIMGQDMTEGVEAHYATHPDTVARDCARPVIVVPKGYAPEALVHRAVVAWDGRNAAARAVAAALPMMEDMEHVTVLTVDTPEEGQHSAHAMVTHLARHGIMTEHTDIPAKRGVGQTIVNYCAERGVGLLVMGAYEHSKMAEDLFGGTTNRVLRNSKVPVLMTH